MEQQLRQPITIGRLKPQTTITQATQNPNFLVNNILRQIPVNQLDGNPQGILSAYIQPLKRSRRSRPRLHPPLASHGRCPLRLGVSATQLQCPVLTEVAILTLTRGVLSVTLYIFVIHHVADDAQAAIPCKASITINLPILALAVLLTFAATFIFGVLSALRFLRIKPCKAPIAPQGPAAALSCSVPSWASKSSPAPRSS